MESAVVLFSGGLDSTTAAYVARRRGYAVHALTVDYGQRHQYELQASRRIAAVIPAASHRIVTVDLQAFGGSALTAQIPVPKSRSLSEISAGIPVTYVPARNTILLALALAAAETIGTGTIFLGVNAIDYSGYPDCRGEFLDAFAQLATLATKAGVEGKLKFQIEAPLLQMTKAQIIRLGTELGVDYSLTHSCYDPLESGAPCGSCDACLLRRRGFEEAGLVDPLPYPNESLGR